MTSSGGARRVVCFVLVWLAGAHCVFAQSPWRLQDTIAPDSRIQFGGWTSVGYHSGTNLFSGVGNQFSTNTHPDQLNLHQSWAYLERTADGRDGWDWGFRADVLYGVDGQDLQAYGHNPAPPFFAKGWDNSLDHG
ncbi:MAG: outer membrane beta-barrel protein, partial [Planctomycetales bacterium]|nr:outer membrane beta-barrel protein [Planctomycetales bacterium]